MRPSDTVASITTAAPSRGDDIDRRQRRYAISMLIRTICFVLAVLAHGWLTWVFLTLAVFLPWVAVILANAAAQRAPGTIDEAHWDQRGLPPGQS